MNVELINHDDGSIEIIVESDGFIERGCVTASHLVSAKRAELEHTITERAKEAYFEQIRSCDI
mgnify:FL=1